MHASDCFPYQPPDNLGQPITVAVRDTMPFHESPEVVCEGVNHHPLAFLSPGAIWKRGDKKSECLLNYKKFRYNIRAMVLLIPGMYTNKLTKHNSPFG